MRSILISFVSPVFHSRCFQAVDEFDQPAYAFQILREQLAWIAWIDARFIFADVEQNVKWRDIHPQRFAELMNDRAALRFYGSAGQRPMGYDKRMMGQHAERRDGIHT